MSERMTLWRLYYIARLRMNTSASMVESACAAKLLDLSRTKSFRIRGQRNLNPSNRRIQPVMIDHCLTSCLHTLCQDLHCISDSNLKAVRYLFTGIIFACLAGEKNLLRTSRKSDPSNSSLKGTIPNTRGPELLIRTYLLSALAI